MQFLQETILQEMERSESLFRAGGKIVPRFRIAATYGHYMLDMPMAGDPEHSMDMLTIAKIFMVWVGASSFVMSSEFAIPNAISSCGIGHRGALAAMQPITHHNPVEFGALVWLSEDGIVAPIKDLLPSKDDVLGQQQRLECQRLFGKGGHFEAKRLLH